ncbi:inositol monophosphatase family protein, partial [uncultured Desulfovibrio sp.]
WAARGSGAFLNGRRVTVSGAAALQDALACTGFPYELEGRLPVILERLRRVLPATQGMRRLGSAALDLAFVACGRLDVFYEEWLKPWDLAAGWLLVEEAGGRVSGLDGAPFRFGDALLATNGRLHPAMTELLGPTAGGA